MERPSRRLGPAKSTIQQINNSTIRAAAPHRVEKAARALSSAYWHAQRRDNDVAALDVVVGVAQRNEGIVPVSA